ncbi:MAG: DNA adenine methylase [Armatimonadetes bacterium]|nr:DNA adenine methylase [Armatimonadota bacterium]
METLLKWPGGKGREFPQVRAHIPPFQTYVEPFIGGGAFFFNLMPQRSLLNDVNSKLMGLYACVRDGDQKFQNTISEYLNAWERLEKAINELQPPLLELYHHLRENTASSQSARMYVGTCLAEYRPTFLQDFNSFSGDPTGLWDAIEFSIQSKYARLPKLERDNAIRFDDALMRDHIATAVRAGMYTNFRDVFAPRSEVEAIANFYFLREFCYGSMFRFNKDGKFNIPYGGIGYNSKDFRSKASRLFSPQTRALFADAQLFNLDFRMFFEVNWALLDEDTFCFLDPPYHTEFSAYDNLAFTLEDQKALADIFVQLPCQAMLIIKDTEFIRGLYHCAQRENDNVRIVAFDKTYSYNVRGRNERDTQHLLICNYASHPPSRLRGTDRVAVGSRK